MLVVWNRHRQHDELAAKWERAGGTVIVAENGYIGGGKHFALALGQHNGAGSWPVGGPERWDSLGVELKPWRTGGRELVLLPQRGIGSPGVAMPATWPHLTATRLRRSWPKVRVRRHPGPDKTEPYEDLSDAFAAVTWGSGAALKALAVGVPVFHDFARWIGAPAATFGTARLEEPLRDDAARLAMFRRLAWAQWSLAELESGEAFAWLMQR